MEVIAHRGWELIRLRSDVLEVDVLPGRGGDILGVRWLPLGIDVLWRAPWGVRMRGAAPTAAESHTNLMEHYPGGWQTVFPNAGRATIAGGVEHGFHGEAWLAPWDWEARGGVLELSTRLVRSPFALTKRIALDGASLRVEETATNVGAEPFDAMWVHHPAFGAPFLDGSCRLETAARTFVADDEYASSDLEPARASPWPYAVGRDGGRIDLREVPAEGSGIHRLGYLTELERGWAAIGNDRLGVTAEIEWDAGVFPYAWMWVDANGSSGFPFYRACYVMAIEPASSYPGQGIDAARAKTGTLLPFEPGQERTITVTLTLR